MANDQLSGIDAWASAVAGAAIGVAVDRALNQSQTMSDAGQSYGIDANGNVYQLGQNNSQMQQAAAPMKISPLLICAVIAFLVFEGRK